MEIPQSDDLVKEFAELHHTRPGEHLAREFLLIRAVSLANILITDGYTSLGEDMLADPAVGVLLNMLHRNFGLVDGAILAFATDCAQMARASVDPRSTSRTSAWANRRIGCGRISSITSRPWTSSQHLER